MTVIARPAPLRGARDLIRPKKGVAMHGVSRREFLVLIGKGVAVSAVPTGTLVTSEPVDRINWLGAAAEFLSRTGEAQRIPYCEVRPARYRGFTSSSQESGGRRRIFGACLRILERAWKLAAGHLREGVLERASRPRIRALGHYAATTGASRPHRLSPTGEVHASPAVRVLELAAHAIRRMALQVGDRIRAWLAGLRPAHRRSPLKLKTERRPVVPHIRQEVDMALIEKELGIAVFAAAVAASPRAREVAREGAVYGLAGAMKAADVIAGAGKGAYEGARSGLAATGQAADGARKNGSTASS
jgi:hypothetical protein